MVAQAHGRRSDQENFVCLDVRAGWTDALTSPLSLFLFYLEHQHHLPMMPPYISLKSRLISIMPLL